MKKRKRSAHLNIALAKTLKCNLRGLQMCYTFFEHSKCMREMFSPRIRQKRRMYRYLERIGKV